MEAKKSWFSQSFYFILGVLLLVGLASGSTIITSDKITQGNTITNSSGVFTNNFTVDGLINCDTIDTNSDGNLVCGSDNSFTFSNTNVAYLNNSQTFSGQNNFTNTNYFSGSTQFIGEGTTGIEIRASSGSTAYLDFSDDSSTDYDARFRLINDDLLSFQNAEFEVQENMSIDNDLWLEGTNVSEKLHETSIGFSNTIYLFNNGTDIGTQINENLNNNYKIIIEPGTYTSFVPVVINTFDTFIDMTGVIYYYKGHESAFTLNNSRIILDFHRIIADNYSWAGFYNSGCTECRITGNILAVKSNSSAILMNNTYESNGENIWNIGTITGDYTTPHAIYIPDTPFAYEGDKFTSKWLFRFLNTSIQVGDTGTADKEYFYFEVGMDNCNSDCSNVTDIYIESYNDKSTYILKEVVRPVANYDIVFRGTSDNNVVLATMSDLKVLDLANNSGIYAPNTYVKNINVTNRIQIGSPESSISAQYSLPIEIKDSGILLDNPTSEIAEMIHFRTGAFDYTLRLLTDKLMIRSELNNDFNFTNYGNLEVVNNITSNNILPNNNLLNSIGSSTLRWLKLWVQDIDASGNITIGTNAMMKLTANTSEVGCSLSNAGSIYYDGTQNKHKGCDGTVWQDLY